jgi:uncharacterized protein with von Willebrand factor type A (vWA) domain
VNPGPVGGAPVGEGGRLAANIMHFGRVLRAAGLPVGPGRMLDAIRAVETVGVARRDDFYWTLHAVFVNRRDQRMLFDQAFHLFWRNPRIMERMMGMLLPQMLAGPDPQEPDIQRRVLEAMGRNADPGDSKSAEEQEFEIDAALTWSDRELLQEMDFEQMSADELRAAEAAIRRMRLPMPDVATRRFLADPRGARVDPRASRRAALRAGGDVIPLRRRTRRLRPPPLVLLCDISGSMSRYSRMAILFMHALTNDRDRVHSFVFGTRLTNITRQLRRRDVDEALKRVADRVDDWSGGTRIGACLHDFNLHWSRRVLGQGAVVLLISDGLDRDAGEGLEREIERLAKSCRRLVWLNPLLRWDGFEPRATGVRAILPHVDEFRPVHNLHSLGDLADALSRPAPPMRAQGARDWMARKAAA